MTALWQWLQAQGLVRDIVATVVGVTGAHLAGWRPKRHQRTQEQIADRLDTSTPGGLGEIVKRKQ